MSEPIEPRMHFWFKLAISQFESAMYWRSIKDYKEAIKGIKKTREFMELAGE